MKSCAARSTSRRELLKGRSKRQSRGTLQWHFLRAHFASEERVNEALRLLVELRDLLPEAARDLREPFAQEALRSAAQCFARSPCQALALALLNAPPPEPAPAPRGAGGGPEPRLRVGRAF